MYGFHFAANWVSSALQGTLGGKISFSGEEKIALVVGLATFWSVSQKPKSGHLIDDHVAIFPRLLAFSISSFKKNLRPRAKFGAKWTLTVVGVAAYTAVVAVDKVVEFSEVMRGAEIRGTSVTETCPPGSYCASICAMSFSMGASASMKNSSAG